MQLVQRSKSDGCEVDTGKTVSKVRRTRTVKAFVPHANYSAVTFIAYNTSMD